MKMPSKHETGAALTTAAGNERKKDKKICGMEGLSMVPFTTGGTVVDGRIGAIK